MNATATRPSNTLSTTSSKAAWSISRFVPVIGGAIGLAVGWVFGLPIAAALIGFAQTYMVPAFVELYASGIPFCG